MTPLTDDILRDVLKAQLKDHYGQAGPAFDHMTRLDDLGLDPLDHSEVIMAIEDRLSRMLPDKCLDADTVGELIALANKDMPAGKG